MEKPTRSIAKIVAEIIAITIEIGLPALLLFDNQTPKIICKTHKAKSIYSHMIFGCPAAPISL